MTKMIPLTRGKAALVDDADYKRLNIYKWYCLAGYAARTITTDRKKKTIFMHREIVAAPDGMETDHINGIKLDNRRENLRLCTHEQNTRNRPGNKNTVSGFKGVSFHKATGKWQVHIMLNGHLKHLGCFDSAELAAHIYDKAALKYHGEFARLNFTEIPAGKGGDN